MRGRRAKARRKRKRLRPLHCHAEHWARNEDLKNDILGKRWHWIFCCNIPPADPPTRDFFIADPPPPSPDDRSCSVRQSAILCRVRNILASVEVAKSLISRSA